MNRLLQNGNSDGDSNGLDLTMRLGLPVCSNDDRAAATSEAAAREQRQRYNGFIYVGPYNPNRPIINVIEIPDNITVNLPSGLPQVTARREAKPIVLYGPIRPGGEPVLYWGYMTKSYMTIHIPAAPANNSVAAGTPQNVTTALTRTYVSHPDQMCNNLSCSRTLTSRWRTGPFGPKTLCDTCGIEFRRFRDSIAGFVTRRMAEITARSNIQMPDNL